MNGQKKILSTSSVLIGLCLTMTANVLAEVVLEEVIVTATKRGEVSVQNTVGGIRAITGDFLERNNLRTFEDIARLEPSLQFAKAGAGDLQPIIRGIQSPGAGTVGVYFDETIITGANFEDGGGRTPDIGAYDIDRVEILKGPQGTLFGASSMSGTVRFISNKPDASAIDANLRVGGNAIEDGDPGFGVDGMINIPVVKDVFALRGVVWNETRGGFIDEYVGLNAVTLNKDADDMDKTGGRIMARFTPNDRMTFDAYAMYQKTDVDGPVGFSPVLTGANTPTPIIAGPPFFVGQTAPALLGFAGDRIITVPAHEQNDNEVLMMGLTMDIDLGFGSLLLTVSDFDYEFFSQTDTTGIATNFGLLDVGAFFGAGQLVVPAPFSLNQNQDRDVTSGEIRFSSKFDGPINFVTGFFYQQDKQSTETLVVLADTVNGLPLCTNHSQCISDPASAAANSIVFGTDAILDIDSYALFGHVDYELTEALTLGAGIRYFSADEKDISVTLQAFQGSIPFTFPPAFGGPVQTVPIFAPTDFSKVSKVTWDASLGYQHTEDQLFYFKAGTGFRQGGINDANAAAQLGVIIPPGFQPDTVTNLEVGAKTSWLDDRLFFNAAYFKMLWKDIQVPGQDATGASNFVENAAKAEIDGIELEVFARPSEEWLLTMGVTWLDAALTEDQALNNPASFVGRALPPLGLDGDKIPKAPEWAFSGSVEYRLPMQLIQNVDTTFRTNFSYTDSSERFFNNSFDNNGEIGDYFMMNLSADFNYKNWVFRLYSNNVTDESPVIDLFGNGADPQHILTAEPRSFGAQIQWSYQ